MTNTVRTNLENLNLVIDLFEIPTVKDIYNGKLTSRKNKKTCNRTKEVVNTITNLKAEDLKSLLNKFNSEMCIRYTDHYRELFSKYSNEKELNEVAKLLLLNSYKPVFNEEQNRIGFIVGFSTQNKNKKQKTLQLKSQIVTIDYQTGEVNKTTWMLNRMQFLDNMTVEKLYKSLGL